MGPLATDPERNTQGRHANARASASSHARRTLASAISAPANRLQPRSLRAQLAVGSSVLALLSVLVVALTTLTVLAVTFSSYQQSLLSNEAAELSVALGQGVPTTATPAAYGSLGLFKPEALRSVRHGAEVWLLDSAGHYYIPPGSRATLQALHHDAPLIEPMLEQALTGQASERGLTSAWLAPLSQRFASATPIYAGGVRGGQIVGAVALSTPPSADRGSLFTTAVATGVVVASVVAALLAAGIALLFADQLTRPLTGLTTAARRMAQGDYRARVALAAPVEYAALANNFNEMASALERDVAELRRQEALRREMVANISHELATPLTAIAGFTEALLDGVGDATQQEESLHHISREAARLRRLVDQLREVTRLEHGTPTLERGPVPVAGLVEATVAVVAPEAERREVTIVNAVPADLPPALADADQLTEVLLNLLDNALRHTPAEGMVTVSGEVSDDMVQVSVSDTGPGIPAEERARIFDRFYRVDPSRAAATGGTGLGLAIVRGLVETHGGRIWVDDAPGGGARFAFTLPIATP